MKKIFTVLMAFSIALCTMAGSTFSVAERIDLTKVSTPKMEKSFTPVEKTSKVVRVDKQEARQAMVEARQAKTVAPVAVKGVRQIEAMPVAEKQALPVVNNKQRAAAATAATDTVEIAATTWEWEYYESDNDWYTRLTDATKTYEIYLDYVSTTQAGTFTEDDCLMDYTGLYIYDEEGSRTLVGFTEVDIVVTDDENGLALNAALLSTDNVLYVVSAFIAPLPEPKATVELAYANATLEDGTRSSGTFQFWGDENGVYTSLLFASDQVEGEYNKFDMYVDYANYIMFVDDADTTFVDFLDLNAVVTKEGKTYNLVADALGSDTIMYHITMSYTKPDPTDTIDIVATNMVVDEFEFWGMVFCTVQASNDEYTVTLDMANGLPMGELTSEDFNVEWSSVYRIADEEEIVFEEIISATVSEVEGKPAVKAQVVGVDNIVYNLDLSYVVPEPTDTVNVVFDDVVEAQYYGESADYYIVNENENYIVVLDIFEERGNLMGEYTAEDFDMYYTQLGVIEAGDTTAVEIADAKAVVTPVEEGIVLIEAELIGMNAVLYKVSTKADVSNKGLQYDATEGFLMDEYTTEDLYTISDESANGYIMLDVESADGNDLMGLVFWVDGADENTIIPTGTYPIDASGEAGTVMASTGYGANGFTYSLYVTLDEEGYIVEPCWFMVGGEVVVSEENGILSITVDAVNSNNLPIYITCEYDLSTKQGLQYDMTEGSVERTYSNADVVEINTEYVAQYGELYLDITAADGSDMISLAFFVEATDDEITIPAGVYPINDSGEYGTVYASPGVMDGSIYPSFYGVLSPNGGISVPCYFMVGGQVVVENVNGALKLTIDALNSYDVPAHIVYEVTPEPEYMLLEDEITNLVIDLESMAIIGGPSTMWQVEVFLGLAEDDNMDGQWSLSPESSVAIMGFDARLIDGYVYDIDVNAPAAKAVLYVEDSGFFYEIKLDMTSTPQESIVVVVEDATVQIDTIPLFGDQVDYALKMTADWTYAEDGVTYPVLVEVPVYYPEATEPSEMTCTVTIGGMGDTDPWLGFGEGTLTITTEGGVVTAKGLVSNPYTGVAFDVTVSGKLPQGSGTGIDNVQVEVKTVKMIQNGQLIINRNGKAYNAIGVQVK